MPATTIRKLNRAIDERIGSQDFLRRSMNHIFPDNWSFMLGEIAVYCFMILVITGVWLAFFFDPSDTEVIYRGSYAPLHGLSMPKAYESVVHISLEVRSGMLMRQIHHWAADLFLASIACHMIRLFFTGAFRKPRELNWIVGVTLLLLAIFNGFAGYSLPEDMMSGLGLRIGYSICESIPLIGNWVAYLFFGGQYPSTQLDHRLYLFHVFVIPLLIFALLGVHLGLIWHQKHTQFPGAGRTEKRLVGSQLWPTYAFRSIALMLAVTGALVLLGGLVQINPIWEYGPYHPYVASSFAQPDWYTGWMEGSLRLMPPWRLHLWGWTVSEVFWPAVVLPGLTFLAFWTWPFLERWWTGDRLYHNLLDRPRDRPGRTAIGVGGLTFFVILTIAGGQDVLGFYIDMQQVPVTYALRGLVIGLPIITGFLAWKVCKGLQGVPVEPVELPEGSSESAIPPPEDYLPPRARWQRNDTGEPELVADGSADRSALRRAAAAVGVVVIGRVLRRRAGATPERESRK